MKENDNDYTVAVFGKVRNNTLGSFEQIVLSVSFFDANGTLISMDLIYILNVPAGATRAFTDTCFNLGSIPQKTEISLDHTYNSPLNTGN